MIIEIYKGRTQLLLRVPTFKVRYWSVIIGDNGEPVYTSEMYTQKHNVTEMNKKYFPEAELVDKTGE